MGVSMTTKAAGRVVLLIPCSSPLPPSLLLLWSCPCSCCPTTPPSLPPFIWTGCQCREDITVKEIMSECSDDLRGRLFGFSSSRMTNFLSGREPFVRQTSSPLARQPSAGEKLRGAFSQYFSRESLSAPSRKEIEAALLRTLSLSKERAGRV